MYNINVNVANAANNLLVETSCTTPRTPEILNSLIAMTNPLDSYGYGDVAHKTLANGPQNITTTSLSSGGDSNSSSSSQLESPTTNNPPSIKKTCSQLIKAGLKLSIEQKRKHTSDGEDLLDLDKVKRIKRTECSESEDDKLKMDNEIHNSNWTWCENDDNYSKLTPEDEERRRRRRERNKIAATKCRLKKRERTANLMTESETLETQNMDLKNQVQKLKSEMAFLTNLLASHRPQCPHNIRPATRDSLCRLPPVSSVMDNHPYSRPGSVEPLYRPPTHSLDAGGSPAGFPQDFYHNPPSVLSEDASEYNYTDLETVVSNSYSYNPTQCHNYSGNPNYNNTPGIDNGCMA